MSNDEKTYPTWGYHETEPPRVFDLKEGEDLPKGWEDSPAAFEKPAKAKDVGKDTARSGSTAAR
jgi:hypothetical protein